MRRSPFRGITEIRDAPPLQVSDPVTEIVDVALIVRDEDESNAPASKFA